MTAERRVLFVCVENAARSLMAEAIFNANPPAGWVAESAGTRPAAGPNPRTARFLQELGLPMPSHPPQELRLDQLATAEIVVTMGCLDAASCPAHLSDARPRDWGLPDPSGLDDSGFRQVRDSIRIRVGSLVVELAARGPPGWGP